MWAARHLSVRQQRKFVGAGGGRSEPRRKDQLARSRAIQREKERRRLGRDYVREFDKEIGVEHPGEDESSFSAWDWISRKTCRVCGRKPIVRYCSRCEKHLCGECIVRGDGRFKWLCLECASASDDSEEQSRRLVQVLNEEVPDRTIVVSVPQEESVDLDGTGDFGGP